MESILCCVVSVGWPSSRSPSPQSGLLPQVDGKQEQRTKNTEQHWSSTYGGPRFPTSPATLARFSAAALQTIPHPRVSTHRWRFPKPKKTSLLFDPSSATCSLCDDNCQFPSVMGWRVLDKLTESWKGRNSDAIAGSESTLHHWRWGTNLSKLKVQANAIRQQVGTNSSKFLRERNIRHSRMPLNHLQGWYYQTSRWKQL